MDLQFRKLRADEIDVRVGSVKDNGLSLLLYKDARVDMSVLDETVGKMNWKREHFGINDRLFCTVSIWDDDKKQWVSKQDVGTESYAEKEKGQASDSFKRACFSWGIGIELYDSPFIWVNSKDCKIVNKKCYDKFYVEKITYNPHTGAIDGLSIKNKSKNDIRVFVQKPSGE